VLLFILLMFAILYHILLVELEDDELDVHNYFGSSLWKGIPSLLVLDA